MTKLFKQLFDILPISWKVAYMNNQINDYVDKLAYAKNQVKFFELKIEKLRFELDLLRRK